MSVQPMPYEITLREILRIIFKKMNIIAAVFILSLAGAFVYLNMTVPSYKASTRILISAARKTVAPDYTELDAIRRAQPNVTQEEIVKGGAFLEQVVRDLNLDQRDDEKQFYPRLKKILQPVIDALGRAAHEIYASVKAIILGKSSRAEMSKVDEAIIKLAGNIEVDQVEDSDIFYFNVYDYNPEMAPRIANDIAKQYIIFDLQQQILNLNTLYGQQHPRIMQLTQAIDELKSAGDSVDLKNISGAGLATVKVVETPSVPYKSSKPRARIIYILTMIAGLIGGISLAFMTTVMDNTLKNPWELESQTGVPVLSSIPRQRNGKDPLAHLKEGMAHQGGYLSAFTRLTDHLYILIREKQVKTIAIADLDDSTNSAVDAFNIAYLLANSYQLKTILVDADFRNPVLAQALSIKNAGTLDKAQITHVEKLAVLASAQNKQNPLLLLTGQDMQKLLGELKAQYDVVIVHAPSFTECNDPYIISRQSDGVLVSLREDQVKREIADSIFSTLKKENRTIFGVIFNDRSYPIPERIYRNV